MFLRHPAPPDGHSTQSSPIARLARCLGLAAAIVATHAPVFAQQAGDDDAALIEEARTAVHPGEARFWQAVIALQTPGTATAEDGQRLLSAAAEAGFAPAQTALGEILLAREADPASQRKAVEWFRMAAEQGDVLAKAYLGQCLYIGIGFRRDPVAARRWLIEATVETPRYTPPQPTGEIAARLEALQASPNAGAPVAPHSWEVRLALAAWTLAVHHEFEGHPALALPLYESAAYFGAAKRFGLAAAASRAAALHALGRGAPGNLAEATRLLDRSRELEGRPLQAAIGTMWTHEPIGALTVDALQTSVARLTAARIADLQLEEEDTLAGKDPAEASRWYGLAAESGEGWAMQALAEMLRTGRGGPADPEAACRWFRRAAKETGSTLAWADYGVCLREGIGTAADPAACARIADTHKGDSFACALLAAGLKPTELTYAGWFNLMHETALAGTLPEAQFFWALYLVQFETPPSSATLLGKLIGHEHDVRTMLESAAEAGHVEAMLHLGLLHVAARFSPEPDLELGRSWLKKGMAAGSSECARQLGRFETYLKSGRGPAAARTYYERAIALDPANAQAHFELAETCRNLLEHRINDADREALRETMIRNYEEADRLGEEGDAAFQLGLLFHAGGLVPQDFPRAYACFDSATTRGVVRARFFLGRMHEHGEGVPTSLHEALTHYRIAALDGDRDALNKVCEIYLASHGTDQTPAAALPWLQQLSNVGETSVYIPLGDALMGLGRYQAARKHFLALRNHTLRQVSGAAYDRLALIYERGLGLPADPEKARRFTDRALTLQCPDTLCRVGMAALAADRIGEAVPLLGKASDGGSGAAAYVLAGLYREGRGVLADAYKADRLMHEAASRGHAPALLALATATLGGTADAPPLEDAIRMASEAERSGLPGATEVREKLKARRAGAPPTP